MNDLWTITRLMRIRTSDGHRRLTIHERIYLRSISPAQWFNALPGLSSPFINWR